LRAIADIININKTFFAVIDGESFSSSASEEILVGAFRVLKLELDFLLCPQATFKLDQ
jgi:hypothetical protein